jgi:flagellar FliL protein
MAKSFSSNKKLITVVILLIFIVISAAIGAVYYLTQESTPSTTTTQQQKSAETNNQDETLSQIGPLYPLAPITVNLRNQNDKDVYLKITLSLELNNKLLANELDAKNAVIRDKIILILSSKTVDGLSSTMGKAEVCNTIKDTLNAMFTDGQIRHVYIVNFVIQ